MQNIEWLQMLIGMLGGGSLVGVIVGLVTIPSTKKKANGEEAAAKNAEIENIKSALTEWQKIAEERQEACHEKDGRISELTKQVDERYVDIGQWRDKYNAKQEEITSLRVKIATDELKMCQLKGCEKRTPPTGW